MATFLVTGGCGYIGSHLVDALLGQNHSVRVLDDLSTGKRQHLSPSATLLVGDVHDFDTVKDTMKGVDGCFHLAATPQTAGDDNGPHHTNLTGTINVFEAARHARRGKAVRVVYASSALVYRDSFGPMGEDDEPQPGTAYGADKRACELFANVAAVTQRVPNLGLRIFSVYGPDQDPTSPSSGVVAVFLDRVRRKQPLQIYGDGNQTRDFVHVTDAVKFLIAGMRHRDKSPLIFNVCTGRPTSIKTLATAVASVYHEQTFVNYGPDRYPIIRNLVGDPTKANKVLKIRADIDLMTGLQMSTGRLVA